MKMNQNETRERELEVKRREARAFVSRPLTRASRLPTRAPNAFTLTELLVVIAIIGILAGLITGAAVGAMKAAQRARIVLEIQQLSNAMEEFKNENGAYPPNVFPGTDPALGLTSAEQSVNAQQLVRALRKAFPRSSEFNSTSAVTNSDNNVTTIANVGLSPAEALVFWLQGFSNDPARPISGTDLNATSIEDTNPVTQATNIYSNVITMDSYQPKFDFDKQRLKISRTPSGDRRFLTVQRVGDTTNYQIQLYEYVPSGSEEPYVYFDTSRETPLQVAQNWVQTEFFYSSPRAIPGDPQIIYPLKRLKSNAPPEASMANPKLQFVEYVEQGKFQVLHCGIDDLWGNFSTTPEGSKAQLTLGASGNVLPLLLFPSGPFTGDISDTLCNFTTGTLEDEQE